MRLSVAREAASLRDMTVPELRERYQEIFGEECRSRHKDFIRKRRRERAVQDGGQGRQAEGIVMEIELPFPPSVNHYYRRVGPRTLISRDGRAYRQRVTSVLAALRVRPVRGAIRMHIDVYPPDNRRRDLDNLQKSLWDALQKGGAYLDDSQVVKFTVERREVVSGGKVIVRIEEIA